MYLYRQMVKRTVKHKRTKRSSTKRSSTKRSSTHKRMKGGAREERMAALQKAREEKKAAEERANALAIKELDIELMNTPERGPARKEWLKERYPSPVRAEGKIRSATPYEKMPSGKFGFSRSKTSKSKTPKLNTLGRDIQSVEEQIKELEGKKTFFNRNTGKINKLKEIKKKLEMKLTEEKVKGMGNKSMQTTWTKNPVFSSRSSTSTDVDE